MKAGSRSGRASVLLLAAGAVVAASPVEARAQILASEEATFTQTIDGTVLTMTYSRPSRRGRDPLFGGVVHWHRWTPGANWATTLEVSKEVTLDGHPVPAGKYSVWLDVSEAEPWQMVLDRDARIFHTDSPPDKETQIRFPVARGEGPETETLLWNVDRVRADGGLLTLQWGTTRVAMDLKVPSSRRLTTTPAEAGPILGRWEGNYGGPGGAPGPGLALNVTYDETSERVMVEMVMEGMDADAMGDAETYFLPVTDLVFTLAWGEGGEIWETFPGFVEFTPDETGRAMSLVARDGETDEIWLSARRVEADGGRGDT